MGFDNKGGRGGSRGGNRGATRGGNRGGRGGYGRRMEDEGPPEYVEELGEYSHVYENDLVCKITHEKIPYFNAPIYLENKEVIGKVDEVFGQLAEPYFHLKLSDSFKATSFKENSKFYIAPFKLLTKDRLIPQPKVAGQRGASRGGRGSDRGRGGPARGSFNRGGSSRGGRGGSDRGSGFNRGGSFRGRGGFDDKKRSFGGDNGNAAKRVKFD